MKQITGDIWDQPGYRVIPTNLSVNARGDAVMGRGVAKQAADLYPGLPKRYGVLLKSHSVHKVFIDGKNRIVCLPVKKRWNDKANVEIIIASLHVLISCLYDDDEVYLPLLGCGYGELTPDKVLPILQDLDDKFTLVLRAHEVEEKYPESFKPSVRNDQRY